MRCALLCKVALCSIAGCAAPVFRINTSSLHAGCQVLLNLCRLCHGHVYVLLLLMLLQGPHASASHCVSVC
jgi:hypothetical protein